MEKNIDIPDGWEISSFGDNNFKIIGSGVKYFENSKDYLSTSSIERDNVLFVEEEITFKDRPSRANMQPIENSIWFAKMKNTLKIFYPKRNDLTNVILSTGFCGIYSPEVEISLIKQILLSKGFNSQKDLLAEGSTQEAVNNFKIKQIKFLLPKNRKEQSKIAEILSKVDKAISETEVIIAKYSLIKSGLMQDLLTKGIDEKGNIRSEETHDFKDSPFGRIPKEWDFLPIANVYDLKSGITPLRSNKKYFSNDGHNWVKTLDLNEDYLFETEERVSDYALSNTSLKLMPVNSILIAMYGGWEQIGRTAILKKEAGTNQAITCLSNPKFEMNSDFVQLLLQYYRFKWKQFAVSTRKDPNITKTDIENFILTFPKDITEQNKIAHKINSIKENISLNEVELNKLKSIKTGLMQDLLSGKKRVTHLIN